MVDAEGPLTTSRLGEQKAHPALVELRAQSLLLARLVVALRVPFGVPEESGGVRGQHRGIRGFYQGGALQVAVRRVREPTLDGFDVVERSGTPA